jgi:hypothetical protein
MMCQNPERKKTDREPRETRIEREKRELKQIVDDAPRKGEETKGKETRKSTKKTSPSEAAKERAGRIAKLFEGYTAT